MSGWGGRHALRIRARVLRPGCVCHICGEPIDLTIKNPDPQAGVVDHVVPRAAGGTDDPSNHAPAHRTCNRAKSDKPFAPIVRRSGSLARPAKNPWRRDPP